MKNSFVVFFCAAACSLLLSTSNTFAQSQLPRPEPASQGKIGLTYKDSTAVKPKLKMRPTLEDYEVPFKFTGNLKTVTIELK